MVASVRHRLEAHGSARSVPVHLCVRICFDATTKTTSQGSFIARGQRHLPLHVQQAWQFAVRRPFSLSHLGTVQVPGGTGHYQTQIERLYIQARGEGIGVSLLHALRSRRGSATPAFSQAKS